MVAIKFAEFFYIRLKVLLLEPPVISYVRYYRNPSIGLHLRKQIDRVEILALVSEHKTAYFAPKAVLLLDARISGKAYVLNFNVAALVYVKDDRPDARVVVPLYRIIYLCERVSLLLVIGFNLVGVALYRDFA